MGRRREKGVYAFATPPGGQGVLTGWYRTMREQGFHDVVARSIRWEDTMVGYPYYPFLDEDLTPKNPWVEQRRKVWHPQSWMMQDVEYFNYKTLRDAQKVADAIGKKMLLEDYCLVAWENGYVSEKELYEKIESLVISAGCKSIALFNIAVTQDKDIAFGRKVLWMRYSFLRCFKSGQNVINTYKSMANIERIYNIPAYIYRTKY